AENYTVPENVSFTAGSNNAAFEVSVNRQGMSLLQEFVVPVYIASCSKPQFVVDEEASTVLLNVRLDPDKIPLTADMLSSPYTHSSDGQGEEALVDEDVSAASWWHSYYGGGPVGDPVYGYYIDVTLNKPLSAVVFRYATRSNANAVPSEICIGVSDDGENWTEIGRVTSGLPTAALTWATLPAFSHTTSFTHVRFGVVCSAGSAGGLLTGPDATSKCTALSELELYGANLVD
ncbi:MAG: discoidin domain-containing protein, partial [Odoribacter sp.]|nr:discoidin domain-containing protein [Odoribacter sp.]